MLLASNGGVGQNQPLLQNQRENSRSNLLNREEEKSRGRLEEKNGVLTVV